MERNEEVKKAINPENFDLLLDYIRTGRIQHHQMKLIAMKMHRHVHGVYVENKLKGEKLDVLILLMLDVWFEKVLYQTNVNGLLELKKILEEKDVGLHALAKNLKLNEESIPSAPSHVVATSTDTSSDELTVPLVSKEKTEEKYQSIPRIAVVYGISVICLIAFAALAVSVISIT